MKKYTKKQVIEERISFKPMTKEQALKLYNHFKPKNTNDNLNNYNGQYLRFYKNTSTGNDFSYCYFSYVQSSDLDVSTSKEISFEEFDFEEEIIYTLEDLKNGKVILKNNSIEDTIKIIQYCFPKDRISNRMSGKANYYFKDIDNIDCWTNAIRIDDNNLPIQKASIFLKELNQIQNKMENKKLIGYNFKPEYKTKRVSLAVYRHDNNDFEKIYRGGYNFTHDSDTCRIIKELGTLDLWCYPVYEEEKKEEMVKMGIDGLETFNLKVTKEGIFHNNESLTQFVRTLIIHYSEIEINGYIVRPHNNDTICFSKTGCRNVLTSLAEWKNVLDIYNEFQK